MKDKEKRRNRYKRGTNPAQTFPTLTDPWNSSASISGLKIKSEPGEAVKDMSAAPETVPSGPCTCVMCEDFTGKISVSENRNQSSNGNLPDVKCEWKVEPDSKPSVITGIDKNTKHSVSVSFISNIKSESNEESAQVDIPEQHFPNFAKQKNSSEKVVAMDVLNIKTEPNNDSLKEGGKDNSRPSTSMDVLNIKSEPQEEPNSDMSKVQSFPNLAKSKKTIEEIVRREESKSMPSKVMVSSLNVQYEEESDEEANLDPNSSSFINQNFNMVQYTEGEDPDLDFVDSYFDLSKKSDQNHSKGKKRKNSTELELENENAVKKNFTCSVNFPCRMPACSENIFPSPHALEVHFYKEHPGSYAWQCQICKREFRLSISFKQHMNAVCSVCNYTTACHTDLYRHKQEHDGQNFINYRHIKPEHLDNVALWYLKSAMEGNASQNNSFAILWPANTSTGRVSEQEK